MRLIAFGANLPGHLGGRRAMIYAALDRLPAVSITVDKISPLYEAEPDPPSDQGWYLNGVASFHTDLTPEQTVSALLRVEADLGRVRTERNAPRAIDLDLLAYDQELRTGAIEVPHPRMHLRNFVLQPLSDIAPEWTHPVRGQTAADMLTNIDNPGGLRLLKD